MIKKKRIIFMVISMLVISVVIVATHIISIEYYRFYGQYREDAKRVYKVPEGFISLNKIDRYADYTDGKLKWMFDHGGIGFIDSDDMGLYGTPLNNSQFIVKYKDEYYIRNFMYEELLHAADIIAEQRNRIYNLGDIVILRGHNGISLFPYVVIIDSVETKNVGELVVNIIKFKTDQNISERDRKKIFGHIETDKGTIINEFTFVDEGSVQTDLPAGEKISMIILKSPDYEDCVRKVSVEG